MLVLVTSCVQDQRTECALITLVMEEPDMFYTAYMLQTNNASCFMEIIALIGFNLFLKYSFVFPHCYIYSPTYHTFVSDPFLWYSGSDPVVLEEEPKEAAGEPHRVGK